MHGWFMWRYLRFKSIGRPFQVYERAMCLCTNQIGAKFVIHLKNPPPLIIVPLILKAQPWVLPRPSPITPPFHFQLVPPILIVPKSTTPNTFGTQNPSLGINNCMFNALGNKIPFNHHRAWTTPHGWRTIRCYGSNGNVVYAI